jgi:hypothetical protein
LIYIDLYREKLTKKASFHILRAGIEWGDPAAVALFASAALLERGKVP